MILQDRLKNWRKSTLIITSILFLAAVIWGIGKDSNLYIYHSFHNLFLYIYLCLCVGIFMNSVDRSNEVSEDDEVVEEEKLESKADNSPLV